MYSSFSDFINEIKTNGKKWVKSQAKMSLITFVLVLVGLIIADIVVEKKLMGQGYGVAPDLLIPLIALVIAIIDAIPVLGITITMLPWAVIAMLVGDSINGEAILVVFAVIMVIKQIIEPFVRGKSLGVSPLEEAIAAVLGWVIFPGTVGSAIGLIVVPIVYTTGKKIYLNFHPDSKLNGNLINNLLKKDNAIDITNDVVDVDEK